MSLTIGLTYDLRGDYLALGYKEEDVAEFDADVTIDTLERTIAELGFTPERIGHARALCARLAAGARWDLVFNIAEGVAGRSREAQVPCMLEAFDIPYTLSDPLVCAVTLDKAVAKRILKAEGLNTAGFHVVHSETDIEKVALPFPLFAKPIAEGTGKGIDRASRITNAAELRAVCQTLLLKFNQPVLVEEFLPGREFTVAILGTGAKAGVLGTMEVCFRPNANTTIYTYEVKENYTNFVDYHCPPRTPETEAVEKLALDSYRALELRDAGRVDIRMDSQGRPSFMEVNPLPGLNPHHSDLPIIAGLMGKSYKYIISAIIESALSRIGAAA
ncbi:MAG: D-alanine--D-alanine ligase [bacterium]